MDSLQIPTASSELVHDCENCEALCCISLKLEKNKFPILSQDKESGVPCQNLEVKDTQNLFKCRVHSQLKNNWKICAGYSCHGAGQEVSRFFGELGFSFFPDSINNKNRFLYNIQKENLEAAFVVLRELFAFLKFVKNDHGEIAYSIAKHSIEIEMEEFSLHLERTDRSMYRAERDNWFQKFLKQIAHNLQIIGIELFA